VNDLRPETLAVSAGRPARAADAPLSEPVVFASTYVTGGGIGYGREGNPSWSAFEEALGALEGGVAVSYASGMAAAAAILDGLSLGARVVAPASAYMGVRALLRERVEAGRLEAHFVETTDTEATLAACRGAELLWLESPTNPLLAVADLAALCAGARDSGAAVVVDNTFATPLLQRPLDLGADAVMHSVTKLLGGHADLVMGAAVTRDEALHAALLHRRSLMGGVPGPMEAFLALRGLRTLAVRLERAQASAQVLAERLGAHSGVERVRYPGLPSDPGHELAQRQMRAFGSLLSFEVRGGADAAEHVCESVRLVTHATSLGGVETLIERRSRYPGEREQGTPPSLLRLSVGIEHVEDLWADLEQALARV